MAHLATLVLNGLHNLTFFLMLAKQIADYYFYIYILCNMESWKTSFSRKCDYSKIGLYITSCNNCLAWRANKHHFQKLKLSKTILVKCSAFNSNYQQRLKQNPDYGTSSKVGTIYSFFFKLCFNLFILHSSYVFYEVWNRLYYIHD